MMGYTQCNNADNLPTNPMFVVRVDGATSSSGR